MKSATILTDLTAEDIDLLLESLSYTQRAFRDYQQYPSYEFRQQQLARVDAVLVKIRALRDQLREEGGG